MQAITNTVKGKDLTQAVKNQISAAILRASGKEEVRNEVNKVLVKNDVTGLTFEDVVDYAIVENWGNLNPIFAKLHKTMYTKFFYNAQELKTAALLAKALGPDRVIGVAMPDEGQSLNEADEIAKYLGIRYFNISVSEACRATREALLAAGIEPSAQCVQNIPPRERMKVLFAVAQCTNLSTPATCRKIMLAMLPSSGMLPEASQYSE